MKNILSVFSVGIPIRMKALSLLLVLAFAGASSSHAFTTFNDNKWGNPTVGTGATVTWSLMNSGIAIIENGVGGFNGLSTALSAFMPAGFKTQLISAFDAWSAVADITFVEVADSGLPFGVPGASGDIRIGGHAFDGAGGTLAHAYFAPPNGQSAAGDIHFDTAETWKNGFAGNGFSIFQVAAHEIGHAIGLRHTGVAASLMNPTYTEAFTGVQADDIAGAVYLYGNPVPSSVPDSGATILFLGAALTGLMTIRCRLTA